MNFDKIYERMELLESQNKKLNTELNEAKIAIDKLRNERRVYTTPDRQLADKVDKNIYDKLFKISINQKTGEIISGSAVDACNNFTKFWRQVMFCFCPNVGTSTGHSGKYKFENLPLKKLSDNQYEIFSELICDILELIDDARRKSEHMKLTGD